MGMTLFLFGVLNFLTGPLYVMIKYGMDENGPDKFLMETPMNTLFVLSAMMWTAPLFILTSFFVPRFL